MHAVGTLLTADHRRKSDLGQHGVAGFLGRVHSSQGCERGAELHAAGIEPVADLPTVRAQRMGRGQGGQVVRRGRLLVGGGQHSAGATLALAVLIGLHQEFESALGPR